MQRIVVAPPRALYQRLPRSSGVVDWAVLAARLLTDPHSPPSYRRIFLRNLHSRRNMAHASHDGEGKEPEAPWRRLFLEHIQGMASPEFTLATVRRVRNPASASATSSSSAPGGGQEGVTYVPRARTCIFRGLFAELPPNPKNPAERNPDGVWASDLPTFTTDARMDKLAELFGEEVVVGSGDVNQNGGEVKGTGGGGPVEATFVSYRHLTFFSFLLCQRSKSYR